MTNRANVISLAPYRAARDDARADPGLRVYAGPGTVKLRHVAQVGALTTLDRGALLNLIADLESAGELAGWLPREDG